MILGQTCLHNCFLPCRSYEVRRAEDGRAYALKATASQSLTPTAAAQALRESLLLSTLRHPGLVEGYESFITGQHFCIVLELALGDNLGMLIK